MSNVSTEGPATPGFALFWYFMALVAVGAGLVTMFAYGSGFGELVGGDAYNLQIIATRGTGLIGVGVVCALLGLSSQLHQIARLVATVEPSGPERPGE